METTIFLSRLIGLFCLVMGASMLKRNMMMDIFHELARQRSLSYVMGVLMLVMGLLLALTHTTWNSALEIVITLIGWGILAEAAKHLFSSKESVARYMGMLENKKIYYLIAVGYLTLGAYLAFQGFV